MKLLTLFLIELLLIGALFVPSDELVFGFYEPEEEDFYEFYTGQDGEIHYVRKDHCTEDE